MLAPLAGALLLPGWPRLLWGSVHESLVAFLATNGVPLIVELGASLDVLLAALVLQVLVARMRMKFGGIDLDQLKELHD